MQTFLFAFVLIRFFIYINAQDFTVKCDPSVVEAEEGEDATLSCEVKSSSSPVDLTDEFVEWHVTGEANKKLYTWRGGKVEPKGQDERFKDRTVIDTEGLEKGKITITIFKITPEDQGSYTCLVTIDVSPPKVSYVKLNVRNEGSGDKIQVRNTATTPGCTNAAVYYGSVLGILAIVIVIVLATHRNPEAHAHNL